MGTDFNPVVGNWYRHLDKGQLFVVVGVDEADRLVALQHFDGDLEQLELREWYQLDLEPAEAPENWTGPVDDVETDDLVYSETDMSETDWRESMRENPAAAQESWEEPGPEDERDDWAEGRLAEETQPQEEVEQRAVAPIEQAGEEEARASGARREGAGDDAGEPGGKVQRSGRSAEGSPKD